MVRLLSAMWLGLLLSGTPLTAQQVSGPSIPTAEWISHSLHRMQVKGLLAGWNPDPVGHRPAGPLSSYEIAVATYVAYGRIHAIVNGLQSRIDGLGKAFGSDMESIRLERDDLKEQVASLRHLEEDILDLQTLSRFVQEELIDIGVDFYAIQRDLMDLAPRTTCQLYGYPEDAAGCDVGQTQTRAPR